MTSLTAIENRLMQVASLRWINRRENPGFTGADALPAITVQYAYAADGQTPINRQTDVVVVTLTTPATDGATGSADIDAALAIDEQLHAILSGWTDDSNATGWRRVEGGNVSRDTGFCQTVVRYRREEYIDACPT